MSFLSFFHSNITGLLHLNLFFIRLIRRRKIIEIIITMPNNFFLNVFELFLKKLADNNSNLSSFLIVEAKLVTA